MNHHGLDAVEPLSEREILAGVARLRALAARNRDAAFFYELFHALLDPANDVEQLIGEIRAVYVIATPSSDHGDPPRP